MHIPNIIFYLNLARNNSFEDWESGIDATTYNITFNNNGTYGKVGSWVPLFNGTSSYAKLDFYEDAILTLNTTSEFSFGGWFYLSDLTSSQVLYHTGDSLTQGFVLQVVNSTLRCIVGTYDSNYDDCTNVLTQGWQHIFVSCSTTKRVIYVNGVPINETNKAYTIPSLGITSYLGAFKGTSNFFNGRLLTIYLTASFPSLKTIRTMAEAATFHVSLYDANTGYGLADHSGNSRDPEAVGSFTLDTTSPRFTSALAFTGSAANYIEMGGYVPYLTTGYTLSIRFKTTRANTPQTLLDNAKYQNYGCRLIIGSNNCIRVAHGYGTANHNLDGSEIELNTWYMLTATWDGSKLRLYLNGVLDAEMDATETFVPNPSYLKLIVGKTSYSYTNNNYLYAYPLYGSLCDARVYCTALSPAKIYELYNVPILIDSDGTVWGYLLVQNENKTSFTSKGIVATGTFTQNSINDEQVRIKATEILATHFDNL